MLDNNDIFYMLDMEDKLGGTSYPLWSYVMCHVLVAKGVWNMVVDIDLHPWFCTKNARIVVDEAGTSTP